MGSLHDAVMQYVERELKEDSGVKNAALFAGAREIDESVGELTLQQFHAKYRLPATRRIAPQERPARQPNANPEPDPAPAASGDGAAVMEFVERTLEVDPDVSNADLFAGAREIDPSVAELSARQFHAKYPLQVKARLARAAAPKPETPPEPEVPTAEEPNAADAPPMEAGDPRRRGVRTFAEAVERTIELHRDGWKAGSGMAEQWAATFRLHAAPLLDKPVDRITSADVLACLAPIWTSRPAAARKAKRRISAVFRWCIGKNLRPDNPVDRAVVALPRANGYAPTHYRALPHREVAAALGAIRGVRYIHPSAMLCVEMIALTAVRAGEGRGALWDEIDLEAGAWTIPASRMKAGREFSVPLSTGALGVLERARALSPDSSLVFPSRKGGVLPRNAPGRVLRRAEIASTVHGFRSSARSWMAESGVPAEVAEACLAHVPRSRVVQAYQRSDLLERRAEVMQAWCDYVTQQ